MINKAIKTLISISFFASFTPGIAGQDCNSDKKMDPVTAERNIELAQSTIKRLNSSGADVVILARAGKNLDKYGLNYSHLGFAYRQYDAESGYVWRVLHKLNECGTAESSLYRQGIGDFFMDDLWRHEAAWIVPNPGVQKQILDVLSNKKKLFKLHHKPYSLISYAWGQRYQQSNQWVLETMSMALSDSVNEDGVNGRIKAQSWLNANEYKPTTLKIGLIDRLGGRVGSSNIYFDDHPNEKRFSDRIETVTAESIFDWFYKAGLTNKNLFEIKLK